MTHPRPASLARRALPALAVLGASGALLTRLGGTEEVGGQLTTSPSVASPSTTPSTAPAPTTTTPTTTVPSRQAPGGGRTPQGASPSTTVPTPGGAATPSTTVPAAPGSCTGTTVQGSSVQTRFGPLQVAAVVTADRTLCDVQVLAYPDGDRRSLSINQRALPTLRTQAIAANGADIAGVTGATVTADAYRSSLQSALDKVP